MLLLHNASKLEQCSLKARHALWHWALGNIVDTRTPQHSLPAVLGMRISWHAWSTWSTCCPPFQQRKALHLWFGSVRSSVPCHHLLTALCQVTAQTHCPAVLLFAQTCYWKEKLVHRKHNHQWDRWQHANATCEPTLYTTCTERVSVGRKIVLTVLTWRGYLFAPSPQHSVMTQTFHSPQQWINAKQI